VLFRSVTRIPAVQEKLGLGPGELGTALLGLPVGLVLAVPVTGWLIARFGSRAVVMAAGLVNCSMLPLPALATNLWFLLLALVAFGAGAGALDVAMNVEGVAVERGYQRPIMSSFHGLFSIGGFVGSAFGGLMASLGIGPTLHLLGAGALLGTLALAASRWLLPAGVNTMGQGPAFTRPTWALAGLGVVAFCVLLGEGAMADWSAVYLRRELGTEPGLAAVGFAAFSLMMAVGRLTGDRINQHLGPTTLVRLGGVLATTGLLASLTTGQPIVAILGFACVGAGYSTVFPVVISAAGRNLSMSASSAIAAVTTVGYFALLVGPPLIGFAAELVTLRGALVIVVFLSAMIVVLSRTVSPHTYSMSE
jgi:MFS family permease